jgi:hypothetical protein
LSIVIKFKKKRRRKKETRLDMKQSSSD